MFSVKKNTVGVICPSSHLFYNTIFMKSFLLCFLPYCRQLHSLIHPSDALPPILHQICLDGRYAEQVLSVLPLLTSFDGRNLTILRADARKRKSVDKRKHLVTASRPTSRSASPFQSGPASYTQGDTSLYRSVGRTSDTSYSSNNDNNSNASHTKLSDFDRRLNNLILKHTVRSPVCVEAGRYTRRQTHPAHSNEETLEIESVNNRTLDLDSRIMNHRGKKSPSRGDVLSSTTPNPNPNPRYEHTKGEEGELEDEDQKVRDKGGRERNERKERKERNERGGEDQSGRSIDLAVGTSRYPAPPVRSSSSPPSTTSASKGSHKGKINKPEGSSIGSDSSGISNKRVDESNNYRKWGQASNEMKSPRTSEAFRSIRAKEDDDGQSWVCEAKGYFDLLDGFKGREGGGESRGGKGRDRSQLGRNNHRVNDRINDPNNDPNNDSNDNLNNNLNNNENSYRSSSKNHPHRVENINQLRPDDNVSPSASSASSSSSESPPSPVIVFSSSPERISRRNSEVSALTVREGPTVMAVSRGESGEGGEGRAQRAGVVDRNGSDTSRHDSLGSTSGRVSGRVSGRELEGTSGTSGGSGRRRRSSAVSDSLMEPTEGQVLRQQAMGLSPNSHNYRSRQYVSHRRGYNSEDMSPSRCSRRGSFDAELTAESYLEMQVEERYGKWNPRYRVPSQVFGFSRPFARNTEPGPTAYPPLYDQVVNRMRRGFEKAPVRGTFDRAPKSTSDRLDASDYVSRAEIAGLRGRGQPHAGLGKSRDIRESPRGRSVGSRDRDSQEREYTSHSAGGWGNCSSVSARGEGRRASPVAHPVK